MTDGQAGWLAGCLNIVPTSQLDGLSADRLIQLSGGCYSSSVRNDVHCGVVDWRWPAWTVQLLVAFIRWCNITITRSINKDFSLLYKASTSRVQSV